MSRMVSGHTYMTASLERNGKILGCKLSDHRLGPRRALREGRRLLEWLHPYLMHSYVEWYDIVVGQVLLIPRWESNLYSVLDTKTVAFFGVSRSTPAPLWSVLLGLATLLYSNL